MPFGAAGQLEELVLPVAVEVLVDDVVEDLGEITVREWVSFSSVIWWVPFSLSSTTCAKW